VPRSIRPPNRIDDDSLTDDAGYQWLRVNKDLRRDAIARLLADPEVRVGVHALRANVRWIPGSDRQRVWDDEIEPNFHDRAGAFYGTLWRRRGKELLLFDDFD
jgi:hypothetical protein